MSRSLCCHKAWTLDTDGYFPTDILSDPLERSGLLVEI